MSQGLKKGLSFPEWLVFFFDVVFNRASDIQKAVRSHGAPKILYEVVKGHLLCLANRETRTILIDLVLDRLVSGGPLTLQEWKAYRPFRKKLKQVLLEKHQDDNRVLYLAASTTHPLGQLLSKQNRSKKEGFFGDCPRYLPDPDILIALAKSTVPVRSKL